MRSLSVTHNQDLAITVDGQEHIIKAAGTAKGELSQERLLKTTTIMLRQLMALLSTMPQLPESYWCVPSRPSRNGRPGPRAEGYRGYSRTPPPLAPPGSA